MKYSININQAGIADAGFADKTDIIDWAIVDYIFGWQNNPKATKIGALSWISYKHLIDEMPLLGLKTKQAVSARIAKLKLLGLITVEYDKEKRLYACLSDAAHNASVFRTDRQRNAGGVHENGQPVHENGQVGVHENGHTAVNQRSRETGNQEQTDRHQPKSAVDAPVNSPKVKPDPIDYSSWPQQPSAQVHQDWLAARKAKKLPISQTVITRVGNELTRAWSSGHSVDDCLAEAITSGWQGFKAQWMDNKRGNQNGKGRHQPSSVVDRVRANIDKIAREREAAMAHGRPPCDADGGVVDSLL